MMIYKKNFDQNFQLLAVNDKTYEENKKNTGAKDVKFDLKYKENWVFNFLSGFNDLSKKFGNYSFNKKSLSSILGASKNKLFTFFSFSLFRSLFRTLLKKFCR